MTPLHTLRPALSSGRVRGAFVVLGRDMLSTMAELDVAGDAELVEWAQDASEEMAHAVRIIEPDTLI